VILAQQSIDLNEHVNRRRLAGQWMQGHAEQLPRDAAARLAIENGDAPM
jgi:hypothetical protein